MKSIIALACFLVSVEAAAQVTFSEHIAPIVFEHCTSCHRDGEIGPMPLTNYQEVSNYGSMVDYVTSIRYMPPWSPDHTYSTLRDENVLTEEEITLITEWVQNGMPEGNPALMPPAPVFPEGSQIGAPDLVLTMSQPYQHQGNNTDQYQVFVLPTGLTTDRDIEAIEVRAGNNAICHHAILAVDTTGFANTLDSEDPEYGYTQFGGFGFDPTDQSFSAWVPGSSPLVYPPTIGKKLFAGSDVLLQMHYGPTSIDQSDQTSVNIFFSDDPVLRYVNTTTISPLNLEAPFLIPPNQVSTFHGSIPVPFNASLISVAPHAHLLCKSYRVFAVSANLQDTIPLVYIPEWDFNWQGFYSFPNLQLIPQGYRVHCIAEYDNTSENPFNPNDPPQWTSWGEGTEDEMYLCYLQFIPYLPGDENISLATSNQEHIIAYPTTQLFPAYPNPTSGGQITIGFSLHTASKVTLELFDSKGRKVRSWLDSRSYAPGLHRFEASVNALPAGTYTYSLVTEYGKESNQIIVR